MDPGPEQCGSTKKVVDVHYEKQWENYSEEDVFKRVKNLSPVLDAIVSHLTIEPGLRILDLGCGPAILPHRICGSFRDIDDIHVYGIDISQQALQLGKKVIESEGLGYKINLIKGDCEELPFQDESFEAVVSNATINLLPDKKKGFEEMARVTKKGGIVVIGDCTARDGKQSCRENNGQLWSACISGAPTKKEFEELSQEAGLEIINVDELTDQVTRLVKKGLWDWPEFIQYEMDYHLFVMRKR